MASIRKPRFDRVTDIAPIRITKRDSEIVREIARYRFLRSSHISQLVQGSRQQVLRRLQLLYHHGYLERPQTQIEYFRRDGGTPLIYGLANKGAALLRRTEFVGWPQVDWNWKNTTIERPFLKHTLLVSEIMIAIELACRKSGTVRLITQEMLLSERNGKAFHWNVRLATGQAVGVIPDNVFALEFNSVDGKKQRVHFFLEADTGTMPVNRTGLDQSSIYRKLLAYQATWRQKIHQSIFGFQRFRVLTVTEKKSRLPELIEATKKIQSGKGLFLFTDCNSLRAGDPLELEWCNSSLSGGEKLVSSEICLN